MEIEEFPERSKALAIEVCNAEQGEYGAAIEEKDNAAYRITVRVRDGYGGYNSLLLHEVGRKSGIQRYKFVFQLKPSGIVLRWVVEPEPGRKASEGVGVR